MLVSLYVVFTATVGIAVEWAVVLVLYAGSAVLAYGSALPAVWWVLAAAGDDRPAGTVRMLAVLLPVSALAATAAGVGTAGLFGYSTVPATFVCVIAVVAAVLTATVALARVLTRVPAPAAVRAREVGEWAAASGYEISARGRIPADVQDAFDAAH